METRAEGLEEIEQGEPIPLSALQHAVYCLRQAALIHLERMWAENRFTAEGQVLHAVADKGGGRKARGIRRAMPARLWRGLCGRGPPGDWRCDRAAGAYSSPGRIVG